MAQNKAGTGYLLTLLAATGAILALVYLAVLPALDLPGMLSEHMAWHIVLMNAVAPVAAWGMRPSPRKGGAGRLAVTGAIQLFLLFAWHSPQGMALAMGGPVWPFLMQASLFAAALVFWRAVFAQAETGLWLSLAALLVTGKLYCLMAALMVFAPRVLYPGHMAIGLEDQQLAGLMMVVACPLSYVLVATWLTGRWFTALSQDNEVRGEGERA